ncbi:MAG: hypothetical protein ABW185_10035 [Sedimenticola sp.]
MNLPQIIAGLLAFSLGLWGLTAWWYSVEEFLRGAVPLLLILFGIGALMAGVSRGRVEADKTSDQELMDQLNSADNELAGRSKPRHNNATDSD